MPNHHHQLVLWVENLKGESIRSWLSSMVIKIISLGSFICTMHILQIHVPSRLQYLSEICREMCYLIIWPTMFITCQFIFIFFLTGLGGSVGCPQVIRRLRVRLLPSRQHSFVEIWSWNIFYGHFLPSADSRRADVSFWQKNVHNTGYWLTA